MGEGKWRDETQPPGPPWGRIHPPRDAMAFFCETGMGIAVFSPSATQHWNFGPHGRGMSDDPSAGPCMHVAPLDQVALASKSTYRYRYWLVLGNAESLSARLDQLWVKYSDDKATYEVNVRD